MNSRQKPNPSNQTKGLIGGGIAVMALGLIGAFALVNQSGDEPVAADTAPPTMMALTLTEDLDAGTPGESIVAEGLYTEIEVETASVAGTPVTNAAQLTSSELAVPVRAGAVLTATDLTSRGVETISVDVPDGFEALALTIPFDPAVGGYVQAGDSVTVYALFAERYEDATVDAEGNPVPAETTPAQVTTLLRGVEVLDTSADFTPRYATVAQTSAETTETDAAAASDIRPSLGSITYLLAVSPQDAPNVIAAQKFAEVYLTLEGAGLPEDAISVNLDSIRGNEQP